MRAANPHQVALLVLRKHALVVGVVELLNLALRRERRSTRRTFIVSIEASMSLISSSRLLKRMNRSFSSCVIYAVSLLSAVPTTKSFMFVAAMCTLDFQLAANCNLGSRPSFSINNAFGTNSLLHIA